VALSEEVRAAVVTGGSGGIGRATAERLAHDGLAVVVHYAGNADRAKEVVDTIVAAGGRATALSGDVADESAMSGVFDACTELYGGVDVVVNTAGIMRLAPLAELDLADFDLMVRTNLRGAIVVSQQAARRVRAGGAVINVSSSVVKLALPTYAGYVAGKGGLEGITHVLAKELAGRDITVNTVAPGPTATPLFLDGKSEEQIARMAALAPMGRLGEPADVAEVVSFLAGPARWVNGQTIYCNGGVA
jgi:3-oxoacyl-[acyl-carrier protein] reductase